MESNFNEIESLQKIGAKEYNITYKNGHNSVATLGPTQVGAIRKALVKRMLDKESVRDIINPSNSLESFSKASDASNSGQSPAFTSEKSAPAPRKRGKKSWNPATSLEVHLRPDMAEEYGTRWVHKTAVDQHLSQQFELVYPSELIGGEARAAVLKTNLDAPVTHNELVLMKLTHEGNKERAHHYQERIVDPMTLDYAKAQLKKDATESISMDAEISGEIKKEFSYVKRED